MKDMKMKELPRDLARLCALSAAFGPSGFEREVADLIEGEIGNICDSYVRDRMGNIIALIRTGDTSAEDRQRIMLSAHTDEVGFMITEICEDGLLKFDTVGGINVSVLEGRCVSVGDERGRVDGLVASKAIHHIDRADRNKPNKIEKLYIDIGATSKEEAEEYVSVGSFGTFRSEFYLFGEDNKYMKGKALDDRMGCEALLEVMESVYADRDCGDKDIYFCFTVREEIGLSGARVAANKIKPHIAIVLESTAVADLPDVTSARRVADLGSGGALSLADRATIYDRELIDRARAIAAEKGIALQVKRYVSGGNDAGSIHKSGEGVRPLALSVPTRYLHSPSCVCALSDFRAVCALTEELVRGL